MTSTRANYMVYPKCGHVYLMTWHTWQIDSAIRRLGVMAADQELNFSWWDAAVVAHEMRRRAAREGYHISRRKNHAGTHETERGGAEHRS